MRSLTTIAIIARHWPLAEARQAKRMAIKLIRARHYLQRRGIEACAVGSRFAYSSAPKVLT